MLKGARGQIPAPNPRGTSSPAGETLLDFKVSWLNIAAADLPRQKTTHGVLVLAVCSKHGEDGGVSILSTTRDTYTLKPDPEQKGESRTPALFTPRAADFQPHT